MSISAAFGTTAAAGEPSTGNLQQNAPAGTTSVSDFITVQSLTNFAAMTGAIAAAWGGGQSLWSPLRGGWFPFVLCALFGLVSLLVSRPGATVLGTEGQPVANQPKAVFRVLQPSFIALVNVFVLYGVVLGRRRQ
ncbi:hypothetical protein [Amycolatopsis sp. CB00013]|uniref:hypothetical protein n=1 Tax=Amycolatopsis sp. CB00013 TaxID=1703945 RepID=UPI00093FD8D8|nr:hypothetical protein [Amycolatopsis sp. CB00013]OKJ97398.1 hypothetical protein AMK34_10350 [Amycolatopsis sp. CB00013]